MYILNRKISISGLFIIITVSLAIIVLLAFWKVGHREILKLPLFLSIPAGELTLKPTWGGPQYQYTLQNQEDFNISETLLTFSAYDIYTKYTFKEEVDDNGWGRGDRPVVNVSWDEVVGYIKWLNLVTFSNYRLPTESEWEYTARAGSTHQYSWGETLQKDKANCLDCLSTNAINKTSTVKRFDANAAGLYDAQGNVWEWMFDCYSKNISIKSQFEALSITNCDAHYVKGGSWSNEADLISPSKRFGYKADRKDGLRGFRLAYIEDNDSFISRIINYFRVHSNTAFSAISDDKAELNPFAVSDTGGPREKKSMMPVKSAPGAVTNLLINTDFSSGLAGWKATAQVDLDEGVGNKIIGSVKLTSSGAPPVSMHQHGLLKQCVDIGDYNEFILSASSRNISSESEFSRSQINLVWYQAGKCSGKGRMQWVISTKDRNESTNTAYDEVDTGWRIYKEKAKSAAGAKSVSVEVSVHVFRKEDYSIYWDDITLTPLIHDIPGGASSGDMKVAPGNTSIERSLASNTNYNSDVPGPGKHLGGGVWPDDYRNIKISSAFMPAGDSAVLAGKEHITFYHTDRFTASSILPVIDNTFKARWGYGIRYENGVTPYSCASELGGYTREQIGKVFEDIALRCRYSIKETGNGLVIKPITVASAGQSSKRQSNNKYVEILKSDLELIRNTELKRTSDPVVDPLIEIQGSKQSRERLWGRVGYAISTSYSYGSQTQPNQVTKATYTDLIDYFSANPSPAESEEWFYKRFRHIRQKAEAIEVEQKEYLADIDAKMAENFDWAFKNRELMQRLLELSREFSLLANQYSKQLIYHYKRSGQLGAYESARNSQMARNNSQYTGYLNRLFNNMRYRQRAYLEEHKECYREDETIKCNYMIDILANETKPGNCKPDPIVEKVFSDEAVGRAMGSDGVEKYRKYMETFDAKNKESNQDIKFFGKVVDRENKPVSNARILATIRYFNEDTTLARKCGRHPELNYSDLYKNIETISDIAGNFSFENERGTTLLIRNIIKTDYGFSVGENEKEFHYSKDGVKQALYATPDNKINFVLYKRIIYDLH